MHAPVSRLLDTNVSTESRCNAEAPSSIPSSLITRRRVIILEKEVTAVATQFPTQNEKPEREHVEGMMHAEATFSGRARWWGWTLVSHARTLSTPSLV